MKIASFNVNSLRTRLDKVLLYLQENKPDILGLQEIKMENHIFPHEEFEKLGYYSYPNGQKQYHGVALLANREAINIQNDFPIETELTEKRIQFVDFTTQDKQTITIINGYFPQGENRSHEKKFPMKRAFYEALLTSLQTKYTKDQYIVVLGDFNIAFSDLDIGIGEANAKRWLATGKCSFLPEEREWIKALNQWGLQDSFRLLYPNESNRFSWFDYRSKGFDDTPQRGLRLDYLLLTPPLAKKLSSSTIDYTLRGMEKPSDHCIIECEIPSI